MVLGFELYLGALRRCVVDGNFDGLHIRRTKYRANFKFDAFFDLCVVGEIKLWSENVTCWLDLRVGKTIKT